RRQCGRHPERGADHRRHRLDDRGVHLRFKGQTTGNIFGNATAGQIQAALEALSTIGVGNVVVTPLPALPPAPLNSLNLFKVTFQGALAGIDQPQLTPASVAAFPGTAAFINDPRTAFQNGGSTANTYTGLTQVNEGVLQFNKTTPGTV